MGVEVLYALVTPLLARRAEARGWAPCARRGPRRERPGAPRSAARGWRSPAD